MLAGGYEISFSHNIPYYTSCRIWNGKNSEELVSAGVSYCNEKDTFDRKIGRKVALSRAVKDLPKEVRTNIWRDYLKQSRYK